MSTIVPRVAGAWSLAVAAVTVSGGCSGPYVAPPGVVLTRFHSAAADADYATYISCLTDDAVFIGTDDSEYWQGQQFRNFAKPYFDVGKGWKYVSVDRHFYYSPRGDIAWFDEKLDNAKLGRCRGSGVMVLRSGGWKIAQYVLSMPIPNDLAESVAAEVKSLSPPAAAHPPTVGPSPSQSGNSAGSHP